MPATNQWTSVCLRPRPVWCGRSCSTRRAGVRTISATGSAIAPGLARRLGIEPVKSDKGLGIGVYQVARLAATAGYRLDLGTNLPGRVCFSLAPTAAAEL